MAPTLNMCRSMLLSRNTLHVVQSYIHETKQGSRKSSRVFQKVLRGGGGGWEGVRNYNGSVFLLSGRNLRKSEFYHLNFFKGKNNIL